MNAPGRCHVAWCTETGVHDKHSATLGTWTGVSVTMVPPRNMTLQLVVHEAHDGPRPVFVLVDSLSLRQWDVEVDWGDGVQVTAELEAAAGRFRRY